MDDENYEDMTLDPVSEDWDDRVEEILGDSDYDTDLGRRMARDAIRVSLGEMSDQEFHEKYHEEVREEFGLDDRPTEPEEANDE